MHAHHTITALQEFSAASVHASLAAIQFPGWSVLISGYPSTLPGRLPCCIPSARIIAEGAMLSVSLTIYAVAVLLGVQPFSSQRRSHGPMYLVLQAKL